MALEVVGVFRVESVEQWRYAVPANLRVWRILGVAQSATELHLAFTVWTVDPFHRRFDLILSALSHDQARRVSRPASDRQGDVSAVLLCGVHPTTLHDAPHSARRRTDRAARLVFGAAPASSSLFSIAVTSPGFKVESCLAPMWGST